MRALKSLTGRPTPTVLVCALLAGCEVVPRAAPERFGQEVPEHVSRYALETVGRSFGKARSALAVVADLDGDATDEIILSTVEDEDGSRHYGMEVRNHDGTEVIAALHLPADVLPGDHAALDIDHDDTLEVIVSYPARDSLYLSIFECYSDSVTIIPIFGKEDSSPREGFLWTPGAHPRAVLDCNEDGHPEILCIGGCGYWLRPRGIWAVDWYNKRVLWHFPTGAATSALQVVRDFRDSVCIVSSTYAARNGARCNGTDDSHSYLIVLGQNGNLVRLHDLGQQDYLQTRLHQVRVGPDSTTMISVTACGFQGRRPAMFRRWSGAADSLVGWAEAEFTDTDVLKADVNGNGTEELLLATHLGGLCIYDVDSARIDRIPVGQGRLEARAVGDLNRDGLPEVAVGRGKGCLVVQPQTGEILAFRRLHDPKAVVRHGRRRLPTLLTLSSSGWTHLALRKNPKWVAAGTILVRPEGAAAGIAAVLVVVAALVAVLFGWSKAPPLCASSTTGQALIDRNGRVVTANPMFVASLGLQSTNVLGRTLDRLFAEAGAEGVTALLGGSPTTPTTWERLDLKKPGGARAIHLRMGSAPGRWSRALRLVEVAPMGDQQQGRVLPWTAVAPRVAHDLKSPISTLALATERALEALGSHGESDARLGESLQAILRQVERVELLARNFLKIVELEESSIALVGLGELLSESLSGLRDRIPDHVSLEEKIEAPLPVVWADREQLLVALDNLYDNSVAAVRDRGSLIVSAYRVSAIPGSEERAGEAVALEVADTGGGIAATDLGRIFDPGFSRKPRGSGLGLAIVKRVIDQHDGRIEVHSEPNVGTTFTIYLPAARRDQ